MEGGAVDRRFTPSAPTGRGSAGDVSRCDVFWENHQAFAVSQGFVSKATGCLLEPFEVWLALL